MDFDGTAKMIEDIVPGDYVLSRDENDPHGPLDRKRVLEKFVRVAEVWHLTVNGQLIKTTGEHPFFTERTWSFVPTTELRVGDRFLSDDGQWVTCEEVYNTGKYETVYNFRVADWHTYFVGIPKEWGWSVWAHNATSYGNFEDELVRRGAIDPANPKQAVLGETGELGAIHKQYNKMLDVGMGEDSALAWAQKRSQKDWKQSMRAIALVKAVMLADMILP